MKTAPFAALALLSACAAAPKTPFVPVPPPPGSAAVYFYRPSQMTARLQSPTLSLDGAKLGKLPNDSCAVIHVPPGNAELRSRWPGVPRAIRDDKLTLALEAGKTHYLRVRYKVDRAHRPLGGTSVLGSLELEDRVGLEEVETADAAAHITDMKECAVFSPEKAAGL